MREREEREMPFQTTGMFPTEFDVTTDRVLRTIQEAGTTDKEIDTDQDFLLDLMQMVGKHHPSISMHETMEAMDIAFIGLLVHRHMPYRDDDTGELFRPSMEPNNYLLTASNMATMLINDFDVPLDVLREVLNDATRRAVRHMRPPKSFSEDGVALHTHVVALFIIGMLTHRLMPTTNEPPTQQ
jgi:hypothetical protein